MPRLCVVFDTNAYQGISNEAFAEMRRFEREYSIVGLASYWTCVELMSKSAAGAGLRYASAVGGLGRLWEHCRLYEPGREYIRILGDPEAQVPVALFGLRPAGREEYYGALGHWIGRFCATRFDDWPEGQEMAQAAERDLTEEQDRFADSLFSAVVRTVNPNAKSWCDALQDTATRTSVLEIARTTKSYEAIAAVVVEKAAREVGVQLTPALQAEKVMQVVAIFNTPLRICNQVVLDVLERGRDMSQPQRSNTIWDFQMSFSVGTCANFDGTPAWLITSDKGILTAAGTPPEIPNIFSLDTYLKLLRLGSSAVEQAIQASVSAC